MRPLLLSLVLFAGCATSRATLVPGPDPHRVTYSVTCRKDPAACYTEAARACGGPYQIVNQSGQETPTASPLVNSNGEITGYVHGSRYDGSMLVTCGQPTVAAK